MYKSKFKIGDVVRWEPAILKNIRACPPRRRNWTDGPMTVVGFRDDGNPLLSPSPYTLDPQVCYGDIYFALDPFISACKRVLEEDRDARKKD